MSEMYWYISNTKIESIRKMYKVQKVKYVREKKIAVDKLEYPDTYSVIRIPYILAVYKLNKEK